MKLISILLLNFLLGYSYINKLSEHFLNVDQLIWIVEDIDKVVEEWKNLGFNKVKSYDRVNTISQSGAEFYINIAFANLGGANVTWIEQLTDDNLFYEYLKSHSDGVLSLVHRISTYRDLEDEILRLKKLHINPLETINISIPGSTLCYTFMDTMEKGKYVLRYINNEV